ncbi:hypothetical protein ANN_03259 [Periplaneta americana]|uniref:Uncharacterized protein n=1 Tax=Periplaneta americana TaxID=6978 RepID=A0ABQ8U1Y7_PERAM|nr:hypothetical protein ANN_03259 [Periplaneta americana]
MQSGLLQPTNVLLKNGIQENIQNIHNHFSKIAEMLKQLEARNNSLDHSLSLIDEISVTLSSESHEVSKIAFDKLSQVLQKNSGNKTLCQISKKLSGEETDIEEEFPKKNCGAFHMRQ